MEKTLSKNSTDYVIRVKNDGSQEPVEYGVLIEVQGERFTVGLFNITPADVTGAVIALLGVVDQLGLAELLQARLDAYYGRKGKEDADAGRQTGNGSEE